MNPASVELKEQLQGKYEGKTLLEIPTPAALLDLSKIRRNCARMLEVVDTLEFGWRAHIKTHKVTFNPHIVCVQEHIMHDLLLDLQLLVQLYTFLFWPNEITKIPSLIIVFKTVEL